ncbi:7-methylguanosine phosphate-specific 5'-nucleotidase isoform X1 [Halyomorpha halys]|uniref:7-methylguanosine phosphate-specific 5'-nucleotidase isoform X1 n=1 Tax=Halyomorpha halys TaxID=286706 RepID=UPI0006D50B9D|nr:7-methylguanosine phosphate-specific 5'-nucleotidase-like isoform X1 [Halyomorpha halys]
MTSNDDEIVYQAARLNGEKIRMKDKELVISKIKKIKEGGSNKLQIITDFDRTVSKHHDNGKPTLSSYCVFEQIPTLPSEFTEGAQNLYNRFRVIEDDPNMSIADKIPYMEEWWSLNEKLFVGLPYEPEKIAQAVIDSGVKLRDHAEECFKILNEKRVPVLVFSAGLGHVVTAILKHYDILYDNVKVISNFFKIVDGIIVEFEGQPMNVYNKNQHAIENSDYFKLLSEKTNVVVMGDSLGDANMAEGVAEGSTILKIGFLSTHIDDFLPQYLELFDIVLLDDQTMDVFKGILEVVL